MAEINQYDKKDLTCAPTDAYLVCSRTFRVKRKKNRYALLRERQGVLISGNDMILSVAYELFHLPDSNISYSIPDSCVSRKHLHVFIIRRKHLHVMFCN